MIKMNNPEAKTQINQRLSRIEGQLRGVQKMIDTNRNCKDIIQQLIAIRAAVHSANISFVQNVANDCLLNVEEQGSPEEQREMMNELIQILGKIS
jgi:DNA-binding FrmR family transcriptional regulator